MQPRAVNRSKIFGIACLVIMLSFATLTTTPIVAQSAPDLATVDETMIDPYGDNSWSFSWTSIGAAVVGTAVGGYVGAQSGTASLGAVAGTVSSQLFTGATSALGEAATGFYSAGTYAYQASSSLSAGICAAAPSGVMTTLSYDDLSL
jgi:hypothetical protein